MTGSLSLGTGLTLGRWGGAAGVPPAPAAPGVVQDPRITGSGRIGAALTVLPGVWSGQPAPVLSRQWLRDGEAIAGATGAVYVPVAADDLCEITCRVEATNPHGAAGAIAAPLLVTQVPPELGTPLADLTLLQNSGVHNVSITPAFSGATLSFSVSGDGVTIDPVTGILSVETDALASGLEVTVTATNSGGSASQAFRLTVAAVEAEAIAPAVVTGPLLIGSGVIGTDVAVDPGTWSGTPVPAISLQWQRDGVDIDGATGTVYVPVPADDGRALRCVVTARNSAGSAGAETAVLVVTYAPPLAAGGLADVSFVQGSGVKIIGTAGDFTGDALAFAVSGIGATIDATSGVVTIDTGALRDAALVVVTASNSGGTAESSFRVTVSEAVPEQEAPEVIWPPVINGSGIVGTEIGVDHGVWSGVPEPVLTLQWLRNGAAIEGATAQTYVLVSADDRAEIACRVTASNAVGHRVAVSDPVLVVRAAPVAGVIADAEFAEGSGAQTLDASTAFAGDALVFTLEGDGAEIDPETGVISISTDTPREMVLITVRVTNSGGTAEASFRLTVAAAQPVEAAPVLVTAPSLSGSGVIGTTASADPGVWSGTPDPVISFQWRRNGLAIAGASGATHALLAADDRAALTCVVTAANPAGSATAETPALTITRAAPVLLAALQDVAYIVGSGVQTVSAQAVFQGEGLTFALDAAPAGVTIDAGSGLVSIATDTAREAALVSVRAENSGGSVVASFRFDVRGAVTLFDTAGALAELSFITSTTAPVWRFDPEGFARLEPTPTGAAHGDWSRASGDGIYRCLARWSRAGAAQTQERPFSFGARIRKQGNNFLGVRLDVYEVSGTNRQLQWRQFSGGSYGTLALATAVPVTWAWNAWYWVEIEVRGSQLRARLYPEAGPVPDWQATAETTDSGTGAFGPGGISRNGLNPIVDIRRLEFTPASQDAEVPATPLDSDWDIAQFTERT